MTNSIFKISVPSSSTSLRSSTCSTPLPRRIRRIQRPAYLSTPPTRNMPGTPKIIPSMKRKRLEEVCKSGRNKRIAYDNVHEIAGQLKIDFQKLILRKVLIFMKIFENVFCYFRYSLNLVF